MDVVDWKYSKGVCKQGTMCQATTAMCKWDWKIDVKVPCKSEHMYDTNKLIGVVGIEQLFLAIT